MHLTNVQLIGFAVATVLADWLIGVLKAVFSDHITFSVSMLPKQFFVVLAPLGMSTNLLASLQSAYTGLANTGATVALTAVAVTVAGMMVNDIRNKVTSWIQGTPNLSPSTTELLFGMLNKATGAATEALAQQPAVNPGK